MLNFAVGPVMMEEELLRIGSMQIPYFRTEDFSHIMKENERLMLSFTEAGADARALFLTASGTGAMEAAVMNTLTPADKAIVINGGSFGRRFTDLCRIHGIPHTELLLEAGQGLEEEDLAPFEASGYTALLVNLCETSTGVLYPLDMLNAFCRRNNLFFIVDAISSFIADPLSMTESGIDLVLTGSQKALAAAPGIGIMVLRPRALKRVEEAPVTSLYFNLKDYLKDGLRGQTPFTPAVSTLLQLHVRLSALEQTGFHTETERIHCLAQDFRTRIKDLPFTIATESLSACVTPLKLQNSFVSAHTIFEVLRKEYDIFICPNGGALRDTQFRVGHIGALTSKDNETLINAFHDLIKRGVL